MSQPLITVNAARGVLAVGYQPAASIRNISIVRESVVLNQTTARFSALVAKADLYWVRHSSKIILDMGQAFWSWPLSNFEISSDSVMGMVNGDPEISLWLPSSLKEWYAKK